MALTIAAEERGEMGFKTAATVRDNSQMFTFCPETNVAHVHITENQLAEVHIAERQTAGVHVAQRQDSKVGETKRKIQQRRVHCRNYTLTPPFSSYSLRRPDVRALRSSRRWL